MLSDLDRVRLVRLLTLASDGAASDGEVVNAVRAAARLLGRAGETWEGALAAAKGAGPANGPGPEAEAPPGKNAAEARRRAAALMQTPWFAATHPFAVKFVVSMASWQGKVTPKQWQMLEVFERDAWRAQAGGKRA